jgi:DMSO/TMAO reductase YedYZ molybdopterin-dependent catalytic subunit
MAADQHGSTAPHPLPPGQVPAPLRRFGLPQFARRRPQPAVHPVITVTGAVTRPVQIPLDHLIRPDQRRTQRSDLHCVTTWSARDLHWNGVPFRSVHEALAARVGIARAAGWISFTGLDGYRACLRLDDALAEDVLLADRLAGAPLNAEHGAPVRLIAPAQYGYKSVKHVCVIEYRHDYDPGSARYAAHRRGRVAYEERGSYLPGPLWRPIWRHAQPKVRRLYEGR